MTANGLPPDTHVHTEWSWDAPAGSMEQTCARAIELGLPGIAFTEHVDFTAWTLPVDTEIPPGWGRFVTENVMRPPELDIDGYLESVRRCRQQCPGLQILSGVELSEPHWHPQRTANLLATGGFDRAISSVHSRPVDGKFFEIFGLFEVQAAPDIMREYLAEVLRMVEGFDVAVLAHIDYPVRYWPVDAEPYDPTHFEHDYRAALSALARTGGALEINTRVPLDPLIVTWWAESGGEAVTFGSDAHEPTALARGLSDAAATAARAGFRPAADRHQPWRR